MQSATSWQGRGIKLTFESSDTAYVHLTGDIEEAAARNFVERLVVWTADKPYIVLLLDVSELRSYSAGARRVLASNGSRMPPRVFAHFGGTYATQVMLDLVLRGSASLGSKNRWASHLPDEAEARAWVNEMRPMLVRHAEELSKEK